MYLNISYSNIHQNVFKYKVIFKYFKKQILIKIKMILKTNQIFNLYFFL